jgi:mannose-6-phosphate isomerase-like protein (cupin superfamily)
MASSKQSSVVRFADLEPAWHVPGAKEGGHIRWLISWVGGPKGYINSNPGVAVENDEIGVGYMYLPIGQRQKGLHYHSITEIYIILKGQIEGYDGTNHTHRAGPMDLIYIPAGVPHGVRNCGLEDVELIWLHDGVEAKGVTVYCHTEEDIRNAPSSDPIRIVQLQQLEPFWGAPRAKEPEFLRWMVNWIGGPDTFENINPGVAVESTKIMAGLTVLFPGQKQIPHCHSVAEVYVVIKGSGLAVTEGSDSTIQLSYLDSFYYPAGVAHSLRNHGTEPLYVVWVLEKPNPLKGTHYITSPPNHARVEYITDT